MPSVFRPHGKRDPRCLGIERVLPVTDYKKWQAIYPLREELGRRDPQFAIDVGKIKTAISDGRISREKGDLLYFRALDAAIRRQRKKVA